jgi:hypothetical protein
MAGEANVPNLSFSAGLYESRMSSIFVKDAVRIIVAKDLVMLHEINVINAKTLERFI